MKTSPGSVSLVHPGFFKLVALAAAVAAMTACSSIAPNPVQTAELAATTQADRAAISQAVAPFSAPLTLDEALARALKYNLDRRAKLMEEAIALNQLEVTKFDMLPRLLAQAGYAHSSDERATYSSTYPNGPRSSTGSFSQEPNHRTVDLGLTWNLIDVGLGYYGSKQQADRVLIAAEKRRKAMHVLMQDVRTAFWRAASAKKFGAMWPKPLPWPSLPCSMPARPKTSVCATPSIPCVTSASCWKTCACLRPSSKSCPWPKSSLQR